ncbi:MAG: coenzyme F420-0:L-glutamate ligase [Pseudomonadota bacterium]
MSVANLSLFAVTNFPEVCPGDDVAAVIIAGLTAMHERLQDGDLVVVAQKIISKAENRYVYLDEVSVSDQAQELALTVDKPAALVQLILNESAAVIRSCPQALIVEHVQGYIHANAGIDHSNLPDVQQDRERVLLLPEDCNASAAALREQLQNHYGVTVSTLINDSAGRAWRVGTIGFTLGSAGFQPLLDLVGAQDRYGKTLKTTQVAIADELAAAASFLMGQADEGQPVIIIRGARLPHSKSDAKALLRDKTQDLFR